MSNNNYYNDFCEDIWTARNKLILQLTSKINFSYN
jgi:hypothetical protein